MPASRAQRAKTAQRRTQAIALKLAGAEWQQIADTLGYSDKAAACKDVTRALETYVAEGRQGAEVLRETELLRLDRLQRGMWPQAVAGDTRAADTVLKVIDRRMRLLGLDVAPDVEDRIRREMVAGLGPQLVLVVSQVLDGLGLNDEQRALAPRLLERAMLPFAGREAQRQIDGTVVDGTVAA